MAAEEYYLRQFRRRLAGGSAQELPASGAFDFELERPKEGTAFLVERIVVIRRSAAAPATDMFVTVYVSDLNDISIGDGVEIPASAATLLPDGTYVTIAVADEASGIYVAPQVLTTINILGGAAGELVTVNAQARQLGLAPGSRRPAAEYLEIPSASEF